MKPEVLSALFEQGLMGIEVSADYGGSEGSFMAAILTIEELAKVCWIHAVVASTVCLDCPGG